MRFQGLLRIVADEPVFSPALLLTRGVSKAGLERQLSRWVGAGKLVQVRRGLYAVAEPYGKRSPHPFLVANRVRRPSYVSLQSALAHYGLIPEHVPAITSVTTGRPEEVSTPLGRFIHRHVKTSFFFGYRNVEVGEGQSALVASPGKALLDLVYLTPGGAEPTCLEGLRLQNLQALDLSVLSEMAEVAGSPKLRRAVTHIAGLMNAEEYEAL